MLLRPRAFLFSLFVPLLVRLRLTTLERVLEPRRTPLRAGPPDVTGVVAAVESVLRIGRPLVRRGCLSRALTLYYFLRRAGADVELAFGVGEVGKRTAGHCWLVRAGEPYLEPSDPRALFTEVVRLPLGARGGSRASAQARAFASRA